MLLSMGSQRIGHHLTTEQSQWQYTIAIYTYTHTHTHTHTHTYIHTHFFLYLFIQQDTPLGCFYVLALVNKVYTFSDEKLVFCIINILLTPEYFLFSLIVYKNFSLSLLLRSLISICKSMTFFTFFFFFHLRFTELPESVNLLIFPAWGSFWSLLIQFFFIHQFLFSCWDSSGTNVRQMHH